MLQNINDVKLVPPDLISTTRVIQIFSNQKDTKKNLVKKFTDTKAPSVQTNFRR